VKKLTAEFPVTALGYSMVKIKHGKKSPVHGMVIMSVLEIHLAFTSVLSNTYMTV